MDSIPQIYIAFTAIILGFIGLVWSADRFVAGAAAFALNLGITPMIIGLTVVSFGTSAPEILVSLNASLTGVGDIAIGNALGSNIANIGLVLGVTLLIARTPIQRHILTDELPILGIVMAVSGLFLYDLTLTKIEGWILLASLIPALSYLIWRKKYSETGGANMEELADSEDDIVPMSNTRAAIWFSIGLALLIGSADILVWGAETTAKHFGVSELIIGLTVLAIGTSLPELAASIVSALRGHLDIAVGNVIGSNIFNLLAVMSLPGIVAPAIYDDKVFARDYATMTGLTLLTAIMICIAFLIKRQEPALGRISGILLLLVYIGYLYTLYLATA